MQRRQPVAVGHCQWLNLTGHLPHRHVAPVPIPPGEGSLYPQQQEMRAFLPQVLQNPPSGSDHQLSDDLRLGQQQGEVLLCEDHCPLITCPKGWRGAGGGAEDCGEGREDAKHKQGWGGRRWRGGEGRTGWREQRGGGLDRMGMSLAGSWVWSYV